MHTLIRIFILSLSYFIASPTLASVKVDGHFTATDTCPVYQSIKKKSNPGSHHTKIGTKYQTLFLNKVDGDWVQIRVPDAIPNTRWVNTRCGNAAFTPVNSGKKNAHNGTSGAASGTDSSNKKQCITKGLHDSYVLAVSWQPGFCEHSNSKTKKPECVAMAKGQRTIHNMTLHGLWPNKRACGIKYGHCAPNNKMSLSPSTISTIAPWMPNFYYEKDFGAYQWKKHGTCQTREDDAYFLLAAGLVKQVDSSPIGEYIKAHMGDSVTVVDFQRTLTKQLGREATQRIQLSCLKKRYLQEVRINLSNDFERYSSLQEKLTTGPTARNFRGNCSATIHIEE
ncbi:ribonuclease [Photobacterium japonica]|uniref:ribonuclease T2 family protein n=1 Tax=Photobacterium japonica TaxID=2910235 RepID=UPI003D11EB05